MLRRLLPFLALALLLGAGLWIALRPPPPGPSVSLYAAVDDEIASEFAKRFAAETGIRVDFKGDSEATMTVGLANTLREEGKGTPRADVYWNNEPLWTTRLAEEGLFEPYLSPAAADIPAEWKDAKGLWAANGLRARVYIVHVPSTAERKPSSYRDLVDPAWKGKGGLARPLAGTCLTHMAALRLHLGPEGFEKWFRGLAANDAVFASGNGSMAREVGRGARAFGFTDTDDYGVRKAAGEPVTAVFPDQGEGEVGTYVLPVTVSLVRGGPNPANGKRLVDWLLSSKAEADLSASGYATIPVRPGTKAGAGVSGLDTFRRAKADWSAAGKHVDEVLTLTTQVMGGK